MIQSVTQNAEGNARVIARSGMTGMLNTLDMPMAYSTFVIQLARWQHDKVLIQSAFPTFTASEREFLMTGATDKEWDDAFSDD